MLERILDMVGLIILAIVLIYTYPVSDIIRKFVYTGSAITISIVLILIFFRKIYKKNLNLYLNNGIIRNIMSGILGLKPTLGSVPHETWPYLFGTNSSVSINTDYLICGESPGNKIIKANDLNIKILESICTHLI